MVMKCLVCKKRHEKHGDISFHAFPKATSSRTAWEIACKLQHPVPKTARICSEHFTKDSFLPKRGYGIKWLKPSAVPSVFSWNIDDNLTTDNAAVPSVFSWNIDDNLTTDNDIDQISIKHEVVSIPEQDQDKDCAYEIVSSSCELTIPCNEECNLPRTPSTKKKMVHQRPSTSSGIEKNKRKGTFQDAWLGMDIFKDWLTSHEDNRKAVCTVCNKVLSCSKIDLIRHYKNQMHVDNMSKSRNVNPSASLAVCNNTFVDHDDKVKRAEIKIAAFYAMHDIDIETVDHLVPLMKEIAKDSQIAKDLSLSRIQRTQIVNNVLEKRETEGIVSNLSNTKFSILLDESTSITNDKMLRVLVKYFSVKSKKVVTELLELISLDATDCSAGKIYSAFEHCLKSKQIPISNIVGMASDNASVMIGSHDSFMTRLKKEVPALIVLRCICHSLALIASKACAKLPDSCQNVLHAVATYFSGSAKRSAILRDFQAFYGVESRKILKLSGTRWLVLQKCIDRLLNNLEVLKHYFNLESFESKNNSAISIFNILNDKVITAYMLFLKYSLVFFNTFNALYQSRKILIHKIAENCEQLIKQMGKNFLQPDALENISNDLLNPKNFVPVNSIYVGSECESYLKTECSDFVIEVKSKCLNFYTTALEEMLQRLPYNDEILRELKFLDPEVALCNESRLLFVDLKNVARHFGISDITTLAYEWKILPTVFNDADKIVLANLEIDEMWKTIFEKKNFDDEPLFPNLEKLVYAALSLPHSNAEAERIFSIVTDVKNKKRNRISVTCLDSICKLRLSFQAHNLDCCNFQVDSRHLELHNAQNLYCQKNKTKD